MKAGICSRRWLTPRPAHHTFAFLADGLVVMAPTPAAVQRALYAGESEDETLAAQSDLAPLSPELKQMVANDFDARREILETGASDQREAEYGLVFDVQEASVDGRVLTYHITPTAELRERPGWPQTLVGWAQDKDAVFAGCGAEADAGLDGIR